MNTICAENALFLDGDVAVAVPTYETKRHSLFGIWSHAILGETRGFLVSVMSFVSAMTTPTKEYILLAEPKLEDIHLEEGDAARWNKNNIPADLRTKLGFGVMKVLSVTIVSDDTIVSIGSQDMTKIPRVPYSKTLIAQITAQSTDGRIFIAPNYYFERVR